MTEETGAVQFCAVPTAEMTIYANVFEKRAFAIECNHPGQHAFLRIWEERQSNTHDANKIKVVKLNSGDKTVVEGYRITVTAFGGGNTTVLVSPN